jgi:hypothetical protein
MKMKFRIKKYFLVFNGVCPGSGRWTEFIIVDQYVSFLGEGYNVSFTDVGYHRVGSAPSLYIESDYST